MKILPDSHILVWLIAASDKLSSATRDLIENEENELFFSSASIWELTIKYASGRTDFTLPPTIIRDTLLNIGYRELPVTSLHGLAIGGLPPIHKDPFDRILIAQAGSEGMLLLTSDATIAQYPGPIHLAR